MHVVGPVWPVEVPTPDGSSTSEAGERATEHSSREASYSVTPSASAPCALLRQSGAAEVAVALRRESLTRPGRDLVTAIDRSGTHVRDGREALRAACGLHLPRGGMLGEPDD
jgi:hypothetical protein